MGKRYRKHHKESSVVGEREIKILSYILYILNIYINYI